MLRYEQFKRFLSQCYPIDRSIADFISRPLLIIYRLPARNMRNHIICVQALRLLIVTTGGGREKNGGAPPREVFGTNELISHQG